MSFLAPNSCRPESRDAVRGEGRTVRSVLGALARLPIALVAVSLLLTGCATVEELLALNRVDFRLSGVQRPVLAGVSLEGVRSWRDLSATDVLRLTGAVAQGRVPLGMDLVVAADNPSSNPDARLLQLDWTLLLDQRRTVSGTLDRATPLPSGRRTSVPLRVELDLYRFFRDDAESLLALALSSTGERASGPRLQLEALPTVETPLGPVRYPQPILLEL